MRQIWKYSAPTVAQGHNSKSVCNARMTRLSTPTKCQRKYLVFYSLSHLSEHCFRHRVPFTDEEDALLMKFIATYNPQTRGRLGIKLYEKLVANVCIVLSPCNAAQLTPVSGRREMVFRLPPPTQLVA